MATKMGRPLSDNPKKTNVACRLNKDEMIILEECCEKLKMDKSSVLRYGLYLAHEKLKNKK
jgi:hypothetical protein